MIKKILELMKSFDESYLSELSIEQNEFKLCFKKEKVAVSQSSQLSAVTSENPVAGSAQVLTPVAVEALIPSIKSEVIKAPIVGTFYRQPAVDSPAFIDVGSRVKKGDTLCILEAMKVMKELEAEFDMEIINILADNAGLVEYD